MFGSPDMWQTRGTGDSVKGENIAEMFAKKGIYWIKADDSRIVGWNRMREYMELAPDGKPWWLITSNCANLIKCIPQAIYDERVTEDMCTEPHEITDALDSSRYFLMSRPALPVKNEKIDTTNYMPSEIEDFFGVKAVSNNRNNIRVTRR